ncbi:hypothetical protein [Aeromonas caviae]|uniref:hypothetical protein n=1 Tax=Aeromonas caviae TaxID=648 RepID=UPI00067BC4CA|nr:hypothetical protein [Aeromonas caviae]
MCGAQSAGIQRLPGAIEHGGGRCPAGSCLLTRTLMELAEQDEELHLRFKAIYGELEQDLAGQLALAKAQGELVKEGTSPP